MNPVVREWIAKAEGDYASARRELRARKDPNYDAACFHAQQCIEKYLKALLQSREAAFRKTHDLSLLLDACHGRVPDVGVFPSRTGHAHAVRGGLPIPRGERDQGRGAAGGRCCNETP